VTTVAFAYVTACTKRCSRRKR